ncbi:uncharacterized protein METZ01_LOCUS466955, partial [marine metagenome]
ERFPAKSPLETINLMYNTNRSVLQELGKLWRMSDCEELVGGY